MLVGGGGVYVKERERERDFYKLAKEGAVIQIEYREIIVSVKITLLSEENVNNLKIILF